MRRLALGAVVTLSTGLAAALLWRFRGVAAIFVASLALAAALRPFVDRLEGRRINRGLALAIVYGSGLALLAASIYLVGQLIPGEVERGVELAGVAYERLRAARVSPDARRSLSALALGWLLDRLPSSAAIYRAVGAFRLEAVANQLLGATLNVLSAVGAGLIVLALSAYWSANRESFERLWMSLVPGARRTRAREIWRAVVSAVGAHVRGELGRSGAAVAMLIASFLAMHLPTPVLPALAAGLLRLVPFVGVVAAVAAAFLAGALVSAPLGAIAAAATLLTLLVLDSWVAGRLFRARRYSATLVVLIAIALVDVWGVVGLLVASPLAAAIQVFIERLIATRPQPAPSHVETLADLEARLSSLRQRLSSVQPRDAAELGSVVERLDLLIGEARSIQSDTGVPERRRVFADASLAPR